MSIIANKYTTYKLLGETPLEALERLREEQNIPEDVPLTYAGRLDPAAEGVLLVLAGEERKNKEAYTGLQKTYLAEIAIGITTDTHDLLGIPEVHETIPGVDILKETKEYLERHVGTFVQSYPAYSSKTVEGTQLHTLARARVDVELPTHEVTLISYDDVVLDEVLSEDLLVRVGEITTAVTGDFRQKEIVEAWGSVELPEKIAVISLSLTVGGGFYVRQLAEDIGRELGSGACLYSLVRTQIGE